MTNVDEIEALYKKIYERKAQGKQIDRLCVQLVKAFENSIQAIIKVNKINTVDESDLMVVAHVSIINAIDKFDPTKDAKFSTYADKCIKNAMHDEQRKVMRKIDNECSLEKMQEEINFEAEDSSVDIEEKYNNEKRIKDLLDNVTEDEKKIIFCLLDGLSYAEIATKLNIPKKKVDNVIQKIRKFKF